MLQVLRNNLRSWVIKILFFLLILSFAVWGVGDMVGGGGGDDRTIATVGGQDVPLNVVENRFRQQLNQIRQQTQGTFTRQEAIELGVLDQTIDQTVNGILLDQVVRNSGLRVPDSLVAQRVAQNPSFQNQAGNFDANLMRQILQQNNLTEEQFLERTRMEMVQDRLLDAVERASAAPSPLVDGLYRFSEERRTAEAIRIDFNAIDDFEDPSEETLRAYYDDNQDAFQAPEYRSLTIGMLTLDAFAEEISVSEDALVEYFETHRQHFTGIERRDIRQAIFQSEEAAQSFLDALADGRSFDAAAEALGDDAPRISDLGWTRPQELPSALADPVFAAEPGRYTDPVQTGFGWHVVEIRDAEGSRDASFEDHRDEVAIEVRRERAMDQIFTFANRIEDELAAGAELEEIISTLGLEEVTVDGVDARGMTDDGETFELPSGTSDVLAEAFELPEGALSSLIETNDGDFFLVRVDGITAPTVRPFEQVRDEVKAAWREEERQRLATRQAEEIRERIAGGEDVEAVALDFGYDTVAVGPARRDDTDQPVPREVIVSLFQMDDTGTVSTVEHGSGLMVVRLTEIEDAGRAEGETAEALRQEIRRSMMNDLTEQYLQALRQTYQVEMNQAAIDAMKDGEPTGNHTPAPQM